MGTVALVMLTAVAGVLMGGAVAYGVLARIERARQLRAAAERAAIATARRQGAREMLHSGALKEEDDTPRSRPPRTGEGQ